jgi:cell division protein FtsN
MASSSKKNRAHATRSLPERQIPGWLWLLTGAALGAFVMFLVHLSELKSQQQSGSSIGATQASTEHNEPEAQGKAPIVLEFYNRLKDAQVEVGPNQSPQPDAEIPIEDIRPPKANSEGLEYYLQVASFRSSDMADNLRANLIMMNMEARIVTAEISPGDTRHRVVVGPYNSSGERSLDRDKLIKNGLNPTPINKKI